jgi:hypothetical protein
LGADLSLRSLSMLTSLARPARESYRLEYHVIIISIHNILIGVIISMVGLGVHVVGGGGEGGELLVRAKRQWCAYITRQHACRHWCRLIVCVCVCTSSRLRENGMLHSNVHTHGKYKYIILSTKILSIHLYILYIYNLYIIHIFITPGALC